MIFEKRKMFWALIEKCKFRAKFRVRKLKADEHKE